MQWVWDVLIGVVQTWAPKIKTWFLSVDWLQTGKDIISFLWDGMVYIWNLALIGIETWAPKIKQFFDDIDWLQLGKDIINFLWTGLVNIWDSLVLDVSTWPDKIVEWFSAIDLFEIGKNIIQGLWNGIKSMWEDFKADIAQRASDIKSWFADPLGINSPATVMIPVGSAIPEGLSVGVDDGWKFLKDSIESIVGSITNTKIPLPKLSDFSELGTLNINGVLSSSAFGRNQSLSDINTDSAQINRDLTRYVQMLVEINEQILLKEIDVILDKDSFAKELKPTLDYINSLESSRQMRKVGLRPNV